MPSIINGTAGDDTIDYTNPRGRTPEVAETINGLAGNDTIFGFRGNDVLNGDAGNDTLSGQEDDDTLNGGDGDDRLDGGAGNDIVNGGIGNDTITITLGDDRLYGNEGDDVFRSVGDEIEGKLSKGLVIDGGDGIDTLFSQNMDDVTGVTNIEILDTSEDFVVQLSTEIVNSFTTIRSGAYQGVPYNVRINLTTGGTVDFSNKSTGPVVVRGSSAGNVFTGTKWNDQFDGGAGDNTFFGGSGDDSFTASSGDGSDKDRKNYFEGGDGRDQFWLPTGKNIARGGDGADKFDVSTFGTTYDQQSNTNRNELYGDAGDDTFSLRAGTGIVDGGDGIDTVEFYGDALNNVYISDSTFEFRNIEVIKGPGRAYMAAREVANLTQVDKSVTFQIVGSGEANFAALIDGVGAITASSEGNTIIGTRMADQIFGKSGADTLVGGFGNDILKGLDGNDTIDGGDGNDDLDGGGGADRLIGGDGDDSYRVDSSADIVVEAAGQGNDTILTTASYTLQAGQAIETLQLARLSYSNPLNLGGNEFAQTLVGNGGNNVLDGRGGADILQGLGGNDTYGVDNAGDRVIEAVGGGIDQVIATTSYTLTAGQEIENLRFANATTGDFNLGGNEFANGLTGNDGNNVLNGGGGADTLIGRGGNDTYAVDNAGDRVFEGGNGGNDTVVATVGYALQVGQEVETLQLSSATGRANLNLTGNEFANTLRGNGGANLLDGKTGIDQLYGKGGNDTYAVDRAEDRVFEAVGEGNDTVVATVSYALQAGQEIETLQLSSATAGRPLKLTGNELANTLRGNDADNQLNGGAGSDVLVGRGGADTFVFSTALGAGNVDRITDFSGDDTIRLVKSVFGALAPGELSASAFKDLGAAGAALDADDRILYDSRTGSLSYDADGAGKAAAVAFAVLDNKAALTHADFFVL